MKNEEYFRELAIAENPGREKRIQEEITDISEAVETFGFKPRDITRRWPFTKPPRNCVLFEAVEFPRIGPGPYYTRRLKKSADYKLVYVREADELTKRTTYLVVYQWQESRGGRCCYIRVGKKPIDLRLENYSSVHNLDDIRKILGDYLGIKGN